MPVCLANSRAWSAKNTTENTTAIVPASSIFDLLSFDRHGWTVVVTRAPYASQSPSSIPSRDRCFPCKAVVLERATGAGLRGAELRETELTSAHLSVPNLVERDPTERLQAIS